MPTKRAKRARNRREDIAPEMLEYLRFGRCADDWHALYFESRASVRAAWEQCREFVLREWVRDRPGTRPWAWWRFDAPHEPVEGFEDTAWSHAPQRRRLAGHGKVLHEVYSYVPQFEAGIPALVTHDNADDKDARHAASHLDPPQFESEAAYLKRHGLLEPGEARRADFEPDVLSVPPPRGHALTVAK